MPGYGGRGDRRPWKEKEARENWTREGGKDEKEESRSKDAMRESSTRRRTECGTDQYSWPDCGVVPGKSQEGGFMRILPSDSPYENQPFFFAIAFSLSLCETGTNVRRSTLVAIFLPSKLPSTTRIVREIRNTIIAALKSP